MRGIKFRAWDEIDSKMTDPFSIGSHQAGHGFEIGWIALQCTCLKDKNGKEIYEGDILSAGKGITGVMEWHEDKAEFSKFMPMSKFEIVGNIYENPELLD